MDYINKEKEERIFRISLVEKDRKSKEQCVALEIGWEHLGHFV